MRALHAFLICGRSHILLFERCVATMAQLETGNGERVGENNALFKSETRAHFPWEYHQR